MNDRDNQGSAPTNRRRLLEAGGVLAGAAALFGNTSATTASDQPGPVVSSRRNHDADLATRSDLLPLAALGDASAARNPRLRGAGQPHRG